MILFFAYYRFSPRVYIPLYLYAAVLSFLLMYRKGGEYEANKAPAAFKTIAAAAAVLLTATAYGVACSRALDIRTTLSGSSKKKHYIVDCLRTVKSREGGVNPVIILMDPSDSLCRESVHPLKERHDYVDLMFMPAGTDINSPRYHRILKALGVASGHEFLEATIDNRRFLYVFCAIGRESLEDYGGMWLGYLNRRISPDKKVVFKAVYDFRNKAGVGLVVFNAVRRASLAETTSPK
jgi:hypothetical protein